jgi:hypothetical protein
LKLNIKGCQRYCEQKGITNYVELAHVLELSVVVVRLLEQGIAIGYDAVKDIYNKLGEAAVLQIIDFGEETLSGFKSKYIQVCKRLY